MGKRYYCDYCDKSFVDNTHNRKKHTTGSIHQQLVKKHYDSVRPASEILVEESRKRPCLRVMKGEYCSFGDRCYFSHLTADRRAELEEKARVEREEAMAARGDETARETVERRVKESQVGSRMLKSWRKLRRTGSDAEVDDGEIDKEVEDLLHQIIGGEDGLTVPNCLADIPLQHLPLSLQPPSSVMDYKYYAYAHWG